VGGAGLTVALAREIAALDLIHIPIRADGNCFFNTLATFYKIKGEPEAGDYAALRKKIVDYMREHADELLPYVNVENINTGNSPMDYVQAELDKLEKLGAWNSQLGDFISQMATRALGVTIIVHDWNAADNAFRTYTLEADAPRYVIHMLRVDNNHYELLYPAADIQDIEAFIAKNKRPKPATATATRRSLRATRKNM
jgi:hypothetical protein